ncbi:MAG: PLP-dependent transferase [Candidatus Limnocylindrales bacterium]
MTETADSVRRAAWRREPVVLHARFEADAETGAVAPPIYQTSTFMQDGAERLRGGREYARTDNLTRARLERAVAELEGAVHGLALASGSAATATLGEPGEELVVSDDVYRVTFRYFERGLAPTGVVTRYADLSGDVARAIASTCTARTRMVWLETASNPLLKLVDVPAAAGAPASRASPRGERPLLAVDSTFATPWSQRPVELGADIVLSHLAIAGSVLKVPAALVRLSSRIEHPDDLVEDVSRALDEA